MCITVIRGDHSVVVSVYQIHETWMMLILDPSVTFTYVQRRTETWSRNATFDPRRLPWHMLGLGLLLGLSMSTLEFLQDLLREHREAWHNMTFSC